MIVLPEQRRGRRTAADKVGMQFETDRRTLRISLVAEKQFDPVLEIMCSHAEIRVEVDTKIANNGGRGDSVCPHVKRNLWNLELPTTR